mmetsp:Transcript_17162/g.42637  ORF Transcript_17162/g.42637 Transcript_17162/m.42637 type:complete len:249 (-) Transcript_17162:1981-2727(-)
MVYFRAALARARLHALHRFQLLAVQRNPRAAATLLRRQEPARLLAGAADRERVQRINAPELVHKFLLRVTPLGFAARVKLLARLVLEGKAHARLLRRQFSLDREIRAAGAEQVGLRRDLRIINLRLPHLGPHPHVHGRLRGHLVARDVPVVPGAGVAKVEARLQEPVRRALPQQLPRRARAHRVGERVLVPDRLHVVVPGPGLVAGLLPHLLQQLPPRFRTRLAVLLVLVLGKFLLVGENHIAARSRV